MFFSVGYLNGYNTILKVGDGWICQLSHGRWGNTGGARKVSGQHSTVKPCICSSSSFQDYSATNKNQNEGCMKESIAICKRIPRVPCANVRSRTQGYTSMNTYDDRKRYKEIYRMTWRNIGKGEDSWLLTKQQIFIALSVQHSSPHSLKSSRSDGQSLTESSWGKTFVGEGWGCFRPTRQLGIIMAKQLPRKQVLHAEKEQHAQTWDVNPG